MRTRQRINEEHQRWQRHSQPLTYTIWDIDLFKRINDQYGHEAGDRLLRAVAEILNRDKRAEDFLARIGGEEFVLLLPMTTLEAGLIVANKLRVAIEEAPFRHKRQPERHYDLVRADRFSTGRYAGRGLRARRRGALQGQGTGP